MAFKTASRFGTGNRLNGWARPAGSRAGARHGTLEVSDRLNFGCRWLLSRGVCRPYLDLFDDIKRRLVGQRVTADTHARALFTILNEWETARSLPLSRPGMAPLR
jgi:hypothetical protein